MRTGDGTSCKGPGVDASEHVAPPDLHRHREANEAPLTLCPPLYRTNSHHQLTTAWHSCCLAIGEYRKTLLGLSRRNTHMLTILVQTHTKWCTITPMEKTTRDFITTKISTPAVQALRLIAAFTGEKQYRVLERVLQEELAKIQARHRQGQD
jgi:hypothetical protein